MTVIQHRILSMPKVKEYYKLNITGSPTVAEMLRKDNLKKNSGVKNLGFYARFKEGNSHVLLSLQCNFFFLNNTFTVFYFCFVLGRANSRLAEEVRQRTEMDSAAFERAGREPIRKTYKYDITKLKK